MIDRSRSTFRTRLALQTMLVAGLLLAAYGTASWWYAQQQLARTLDLRLTESARRLWTRLAPRSPLEEFRAAAADVMGDSPEARSSSVVFVVQNVAPREVIFSSGRAQEFQSVDFAARLPTENIKPLLSSDLPLPQARSVRPQMPEIRDPLFFTEKAQGEEWRLVAFSNPNYTVFVGLSLRGFYAETRRAGLWFLGAGAVGLALAGLGAWWSSHRAMRPLERVVSTAERLTASELDQRIAVSARDDREFAQLITVLNGMMDRLQASFQQAARFTADASHELKTPLAVMHATAHDLLRHSEPGSSQHDQLENLAREIARLKGITQSLLLLSQADAGKLPLQREVYDLSADLGRLVEDAEVLCDQAGLRCEHEVAPSLQVYADRALMRQVFQNLLSNAVKYNRPNGVVKISLRKADDHAEFAITNTGPGIRSENQPRLFERFFRGDAAHSGLTEGFGLGLNIAHELARANDAKLELLESGNDTTTFRIVVPLVVTSR